MMELVVAMFVFAIVLVGASVLSVGVSRVDRDSVSRVDGTEDARYALRVMSRTISRAVVPTALGGTGSSAVLAAGPTALTLYAYVDNPDAASGPSRVEYALVDGVLRQTVRIPKAGTRDQYCADADATAACAGRVTTTVLARGVGNKDADPLFGYRDGAGNPTATPAQVRSVDVSLLVAGDPGRATTRLVDHLALTNL